MTAVFTVEAREIGVILLTHDQTEAEEFARWYRDRHGVQSGVYNSSDSDPVSIYPCR